MLVSISQDAFSGLRMLIFIKIPGCISPQIMLVFFNFSILGCLLATLCLLGWETTFAACLSRHTVCTFFSIMVQMQLGKFIKRKCIVKYIQRIIFSIKYCEIHDDMIIIDVVY